MSETFSDTAVSLATFYLSTFSLLPVELKAAELTDAPVVAVAAVVSDGMGPHYLSITHVCFPWLVVRLD